MSKDIAMQNRCVWCGAEQYAPAVWEISHGKAGCSWCGKMSTQMTEAEYREALRQQSAIRGAGTGEATKAKPKGHNPPAQSNPRKDGEHHG